MRRVLRRPCLSCVVPLPCVVSCVVLAARGKAAAGDVRAREEHSFTLAEVKRSYGPEKAWAEMQGDLPCYLIYRPISFRVALPFLWLGVPVMAMTLLSLVIALTMLLLALRGGEHAYLWVIR